MRREATALALLLGIFSAAGAGQWKVDGKPVPDTAWSKSDGGFGAQLVLTNQPEDLFDNWEKQGAAVLFSETGTAKRGLPIVAVIFFTGCARDKRGRCDSIVRYTAYAPDGKPYGKPQAGDLWIQEPPAGKDAIQLGKGNMGIVIEPGDPLGVYKVRAEIEDRIAQRKMVLERTFTAVEAEPDPKK